MKIYSTQNQAHNNFSPEFGCTKQSKHKEHTNKHYPGWEEEENKRGTNEKQWR
jgi:hypothetical protein